ncbi:AAA ATPase central domain-containing protein [Cylindrospermum sp. NIES-4074]|nr:AAA ATPase central domain-containing protein [Cylindrospermum sp. NIES-4074]
MLNEDYSKVCQYVLNLAVSEVRRDLEKFIVIKNGKAETSSLELQSDIATTDEDISDIPSNLSNLYSRFNLSDFERQVLLLCVGMEVDTNFPKLCAKAHGEPTMSYPTFGLALAVFPDNDWTASSPQATLRLWHLIEMGESKSRLLAPLKIEERILDYLLGRSGLEERLKAFVHPVNFNRENPSLSPLQFKLGKQLADAYVQAQTQEIPPILHLWGNEITSKQNIAAFACELLSCELYRIPLSALPTQPNELRYLLRLWEREAILTNSFLLLDCHEVNAIRTEEAQVIAQVLETLQTPLIISSYERQFFPQRPLLTFDVPKLTFEEQKAVWKANLGSTAISNAEIEMLVSQFNLSASEIQAVCIQALTQTVEPEVSVVETLETSPADSSPHPLKDSSKILWQICRTQARPRLDHLAKRIETTLTWDDLILPATTKQTLWEICAQVKHLATVYEDWGMASKQGRGLGINALFYGNSGLGKTTSAEIIAKELCLDCYRIDLSAVVNKYIGETEKNLEQIFDAAEAGGVVLLFDEADALFGKRADVTDAKDRYANMEVSYLLQRMEAYRGLAILTTNRKDDIDRAFQRRLRFVVNFPFPELNERAELWKRVFPANTPTEGLDVSKLAKLGATGAMIRNIALNAAFHAAAAGEPVMMKHILSATHQEMHKLELTLLPGEIAEWVPNGALTR